MRRIAIVMTLLATPPILSSDDFQGATHVTPFDEDSIGYSKTESVGPIARLQRQLDREQVKLEFEPEHGFLLGLLRKLKIDTNSQMFVFSKTSFQRDRISPQRPRALYFNDDVYVGYVHGSKMLEVAAVDPKLGSVFYTLDQENSTRPKFARNDQCLECHASAKTLGVPGPLVRSFPCDENGVVDLGQGTSLVTHRTPLIERWGGWYVTGNSSGQAHRGNLVGKAAYDRLEKTGQGAGDILDLERFFSVEDYATRGSDIVALMVLEHQAHMHNYITRLRYDAQLSLQQFGHLNYMKSKIDAFLRYMLFTEEAPLAAPIKGNTGFTKNFAALGPRDKRGRSLRDFDLQTRLFKFPCSYLIYSEAFDGLPAPLKEVIYRRLWNILKGEDPNADFKRLAPDTRTAIREILVQTKPGLPPYWN